MVKVKVFKAYASDAADIESGINQYLEENPGLMIEKLSMTANDRYVFATVVFSPHAVFPVIPPMENRGPYGPIGPEITKNGPSDDPWKGEFIPVGDPPLSSPVATAPSPARRNVMEQFGASYH